MSVECQLEMPNECLDIKQSLRKKSGIMMSNRKPVRSSNANSLAVAVLVAMFDSFETTWIVTHQAPLSMGFPK